MTSPNNITFFLRRGIGSGARLSCRDEGRTNAEYPTKFYFCFFIDIIEPFRFHGDRYPETLGCEEMNQGLQCRAYLPFEANSATLGYCLLHTVPEGDAGLILAANQNSNIICYVD